MGNDKKLEPDNIKNNLLKENEKQKPINHFVLMNIDSYENGLAIGNKLGTFDDEKSMITYCDFIYRSLENVEALKKLIVVDFYKCIEYPFLEYCFKNGIDIN